MVDKQNLARLFFALAFITLIGLITFQTGCTYGSGSGIGGSVYNYCAGPNNYIVIVVEIFIIIFFMGAVYCHLDKQMDVMRSKLTKCSSGSSQSYSMDNIDYGSTAY